MRIIKNDPYVNFSEADMQFRLTYQGLLLSEATRGGVLPARAEHKQSIRKVFHRQLKRLWEVHPALAGAREDVPLREWRSNIPIGTLKREHSIAGLSERFSLNDYKFVPLITRNLGVFCSIEVLFLRNDPPGSVLSAGDIDNRLKTLFDALTMPNDRNQLGSFVTPDEGETPFFCLLEDDALITRAAVETDTLLEPTGTQSNVNDARVILTVKTTVFHVRDMSIAFA